MNKPCLPDLHTTGRAPRPEPLPVGCDRRLDVASPDCPIKATGRQKLRTIDFYNSIDRNRLS